MTKLVELTENFSVSRPIFCLQLDTNGRNIRANVQRPVHVYRPVPVPGDVLSELVCKNYREHFDSKQNCFTLDRDDIANRSMSQIREGIVTFIEKNLEMRNPRQSKLYRWAYRNMPHNSDFNDVLIMVYKYLRSFANENMKALDLNHIKNSIALLEAIMEKYEQR